MLDLKDFVRSILGKPSTQQERKEDKATTPVDPLKTVTDALGELLKQSGMDKSDMAKRAKLAGIILPEVIPHHDGGTMEPDAKASKEWAFACGQMVGVIAGLTLKSESIEGALNEVFKQAKHIATSIDNMTSEQPAIRKPKSKAPSVSGSNGSNNHEQQRRMIEDLESQAMLETDPAAKAALNAHAERMRKSMELDKKAA